MKEFLDVHPVTATSRTRSGNLIVWFDALETLSLQWLLETRLVPACRPFENATNAWTSDGLLRLGLSPESMWSASWMLLSKGAGQLKAEDTVSRETRR